MTSTTEETRKLQRDIVMNLQDINNNIKNSNEMLNNQPITTYKSIQDKADDFNRWYDVAQKVTNLCTKYRALKLILKPLLQYWGKQL